MPIITRHNIETVRAQYYIDMVTEDHEWSLERLTTKPRVLPGMGEDGLKLAGSLSVLDPKATDVATWDAVVLGMQGSVGVFAASLTTDKHVELQVAGDSYRIPRRAPWSETNVTAWLRGMYFAMICRARTSIDLLATVTPDILAAGGGAYDDYLHDWIHALQIYWRQEPGLNDALQRAFRGTEPCALQFADDQWAKQLDLPPMELFNLLVLGEDARFNEALVKALEMHKRYWTATPSRSENPDGYVAWAPLAIACLAKDLGVTIDVQSEYLPLNLLDGTWVVESMI